MVKQNLIEEGIGDNKWRYIRECLHEGRSKQNKEGTEEWDRECHLFPTVSVTASSCEPNKKMAKFYFTVLLKLKRKNWVRPNLCVPRGLHHQSGKCH